MFIGYLQLKDSIKIQTLTATLTSIAVVMSYVYLYLKDVRGNSVGSLLQHMNSFVNAFKYMVAINAGDPSWLASLKLVMTKRNEFGRLYEKAGKDKANLGEREQTQLPWEDFQLMIKEKIQEYRAAVTAKEFGQHRSLHDLLIFLFQGALTPSRVTEIRKTEFVSQKPPLTATGNFVYLDDGEFYWRCDEFKNNETFGKTCTKFPANFPLLTELMFTYLEISRKQLLGVHNHSYLFMQHEGGEFSTAPHFCVYYNRSVSKQLGPRVGINVLRHSLVNFVKKTSDSSLVFDSLAHSMRHTVPVQARYHTQTSVEKNQLAVELVSNSLLAVLDKEASPRKRIKSNYSLGTVVATVASDNRTVWIGTVLSFNQATGEYSLRHLEKVGGTKRSYKETKCADPWEEKGSALMTVLSSYCPISSTYCLQTLKKDILSCFKENQS
jgi:hypothetical protein